MADEISGNIFQARRDRLRSVLRAKGLDALLVASAANRFYLSGFELHDPQPDESAGYLIISVDGADWLATDSRYLLATQKLWDANHIFIYKGNGAKDLAALLAKISSLAGIENGCSQKFYAQLASYAKTPFFVAVEGLVESLRVIKDASEIRALKASFRLNNALLEWIAPKLESEWPAKLSEKDLAWEIERFFRENGAQELAFNSIVAKGPNAALPHALPGDEPIGNNCPLLLDIGCRVDNYCSDQTRTFWLGKEPTPEFEKTMRLVREAQKRAIELIRPGVSCAEVYKAARAVFEAAGEEKAFTHGLGHGVGLQTHEAPSLSPTSRQILEKGMTVTVEPGLYYQQWGGIRHENTVLVEENGALIL